MTQMPPHQTLGYQGPQMPGTGGPRPTGMAVTSLVLGICSLCICIIPYVGWCAAGILAVLAIIFGAIARGAAKRGEAGGEGMAMAGLICGCITIGLLLLVIVLAIIGVGFAAWNAPSTTPTPTLTPPALPAPDGF